MAISEDEQKRNIIFYLGLDQLRNMIQVRKERDKKNSPVMSKDDYDDRRKKRKIEEQQVITKRLPRQKKVEVNEL